MGSYCYILSDPTLKTDATRVPKRMMFIRSRELSGMSDRRPGSLSQVAERQRVKRASGEIPSVNANRKMEK
jgi:hypothetical protein